MKKALSLALALLLLMAVFSGCSQADPDPSGTTPASATEAPSPAGSSYVYEPYTLDTVDPAQLEASDYNWVPENAGAGDTVPLPLTDEKQDISAWVSFTSNYYTDANDMPVIIELERRTNVHVNWEACSTASRAEAFALFIVSDDLTDIVIESNLYVGGGDKAIADGVYLRLNELIDQHCPNYNACRTVDDTYYKESITNEGNIWSFMRIDGYVPNFAGVVILQDMLDNIGAEKPVTLADWSSLCDVAVNQMGYEYGVGLMMPHLTFNNFSAFFSSFDVSTAFYHIGDDVHYGPMDEGYRLALEFLNEWYRKGYLSQNFAQPANFMEYFEQFAADLGGYKCFGGAYMSQFGHVLYDRGLSTNPDINVVAVKNPVRNVGDEMHISQMNSPISTTGQTSITTQAKDPVLCARWMDYFYTKEGAKLCNYGVQNISYVDNPDGTINMTNLMMNNDEGLAYNYAKDKYMAHVLTAHQMEWAFYINTDYETNLENCRLWSSDGTDYVLPNYEFLSAEDGAEYSSLYSDILTYVSEMTAKFITGAESFDNYDDYLSRLETMGVDRCIEIHQAAFDAYNAR